MLIIKNTGIVSLLLTLTLLSFPSRQVNADSTSVNTLLQEALKQDLSGQSQAARQLYDRLQFTEYKTISAVPSALNYVALGRLTEATMVFNALSNTVDLRVKDYSKLWLLWLTAKQWTGSRSGLTTSLSHSINEYKWQFYYEQLIAELYSGTRHPEEVFSAINAWKQSDIIKQDAYTEALFFIVGYFRYIQHDDTSALTFFKQHENKINNFSLERQLITQGYELLQRTSQHSQ